MRAISHQAGKQRCFRHVSSFSRLSAQCYSTLEATNSIQPSHDWDPRPSPSQLLRSMLIVSENHSDELDRRRLLQGIDQEWRADIPPSPLWGALKGVFVTTEQQSHERDLENLFGSKIDLSNVRAFLENIVTGKPDMGLNSHNCETIARALDRCQSHNTSSEIVALLRDVVARMKRLELPPSYEILQLGLFYAALDLSLPSLRYFAHVWQGNDPSQFTIQLQVIQAISVAIDAELLENPTYDISLLRREIAGEGDVPGPIGELHNLLCNTSHQDAFYHAALLRLLSQIGSDKVLYHTYDRFLKESFDSEDVALCCSAYSVAVTLVRGGRSETALLFLKDLSKTCGGNLPHIELTHHLQDIFKDPIVSQSLPDLVNGVTFNKLLEEGFINMDQGNINKEERPRQEDYVEPHVGVASSLWATITNQPFPDVAGGSTGYGDVSQLHPQLKAHGGSKSRKELSRIIDLLNNYDGDTIEVTARPHISAFMRQHESSSLDDTEFRWCPQQSAMDFSSEPFEDEDMTEQTDRRSPASLGLVRARSWAHAVPQAGANTLHLLHLGYLEMRRNPEDPWQPSGYMVAWDRQLGVLVALYVGENSSVIDRGPTPSYAPFGALMYLWPSGAPHAFSGPPERQARGVLGRYYVDIDPSPDLGP